MSAIKNSTLTERLIKFNQKFPAELIQRKYKLMSENAFRFFRGSCHLFYEDFAKSDPSADFPVTWICGDLHLENFGSFKADNRMVYFDLNDFDEAVLAYVNWELSRVITSIFVGFDTLKIRAAEAKEMARLFLHVYSSVLSKGKAHCIDPRTSQGIVKTFLDAAQSRKEKELISGKIDFSNGIGQIRINNKTHFGIEKKLKKELIEHLSNWIKKTTEWPNNYRVLDVVFRIAGTGSIGRKRYMFLLQGIRNKNKLLFIEMKEGAPSSLSPFIDAPQPIWNSEAERIISVKYRMQNFSPALLSKTFFRGDTYLLQEMQPAADKIKFELIEDNYKCIKRVLTDMASLTASAQIRSGGMQGSAIIDELMAFGLRKDWQPALTSYAYKYARQVKRDYQDFLSAYKKGYLSIGIRPQ